MSETAIQLRPQSDVTAIAASRFNIDPDRVFDIMRATCFRQKNGTVTNEQMVALLVVANQYGLNPFTKEIYAFADSGGIVPVVGIDGWIRLANEHPQYDGLETQFGPYEEQTIARLGWGTEKGQKVLKRTPVYGPEWVTVTVHRKDRTKPTVVTEFLNECWRDTDPWNTSPGRMLRHRGIIQAFRLAFGFAGIQGEDEAEGVVMARAEELKQLEAPAVTAAQAQKSRIESRIAAAKTPTVQEADVVSDAKPDEETRKKTAVAVRNATMLAIADGSMTPEDGLTKMLDAGWSEEVAQKHVATAVSKRKATATTDEEKLPPLSAMAQETIEGVTTELRKGTMTKAAALDFLANVGVSGKEADRIVEGALAGTAWNEA